MLDGLRRGYGIARSLAIYYGSPRRLRATRNFYARFLAPGALAFDVGAHVGSRVLAWRRLGARVVAIEPQPHLLRVLRLLYGRDRDVSVIGAAVAATPGALTLRLNLPNPTIATASASFITAAAAAPSFAGQAWTASVTVEATTLDALIARHGRPDFLKLDVEGFEAEALAGLSVPVPALSVEFVPMQQEVIDACLDRLEDLAPYRFNAAFGDSFRFVFPAAVDAPTLRRWLRGLGVDGPAGDVYAAVDAGRLTAQ